MANQVRKRKSNILEMLNSVLNIYFASGKMHDFTEAHDHYDLWLFDQLNIANNEAFTGGNLHARFSRCC